MAEKKDHWSSEAYQHSASFVPKLATKIVQWLDPQKDDVILDTGCGDGIVNIQMQEILAQGSGSIHGTDSSPAMIEAAKQQAIKAGASKCTFEVADALQLAQFPHLQDGHFTKLFSNAALHWVLGSCKTSPSTQTSFFASARNALTPGGVFAFEMGGLGNVSEIRSALLSSVSRHVPGGLDAAVAVDPWFFPDEAWVTKTMEEDVGGWKVERAEREYRPTVADAGGVEGWVRLFGAPFFEAVEEGEKREKCIREAVDVLEVVCRNPSGGFHLGYVRLRVLARKL
ncbi:S-adenosyl-L-methionine-dependent methyltransferase [Annulohypoxylon maeteangense]|uniref:S-adenosyl-L-methionine-dependent methyltransferase n=1 Tax=Annulohypoxylon maeteangense TaxID=1927788 RepID=UPI0020075CA9|nr:S-adenosyl-L-methionine-dependent methyltransferase [Annulohypoxylon maeteangense]KAI0881290.1 S-adenosyl-L-methionine-dependent methyltransferase [Annulohypoxylon maeteangense]